MQIQTTVSQLRLDASVEANQPQGFDVLLRRGPGQHLLENLYIHFKQPEQEPIDLVMGDMTVRIQLVNDEA